LDFGPVSLPEGWLRISRKSMSLFLISLRYFSKNFGDKAKSFFVEAMPKISLAERV